MRSIASSNSFRIPGPSQIPRSLLIPFKLFTPMSFCSWSIGVLVLWLNWISEKAWWKSASVLYSKFRFCGDFTCGSVARWPDNGDSISSSTSGPYRLFDCLWSSPREIQGPVLVSNKLHSTRILVAVGWWYKTGAWSHERKRPSMKVLRRPTLWVLQLIVGSSAASHDAQMMALVDFDQRRDSD